MRDDAGTPNLEQPWAKSISEIASALDVDLDAGLSDPAVRRHRKQYGRNRLAKAKKRSAWLILFDQFKSLVIWLLAIAAVVSFIFGQSLEGIAVAAAILANACIGFITELKAVRSRDALRKLGRVTARVLRDKSLQEVPSDDIVVGDVVHLEGGDVVPADLRFVETNKCQVNESALTGESVPVTKRTDPVHSDAPLAERTCLGFKGTAVTRGSAVGLVVATGRQTEIGQIQEMVQEAEEEETPLEKRLHQLAYRLIWVTMGLAVVVALAGILRGKETLLMIKSAVALAVAAIPEGLPIVATLALARGMLHMARRNALVNRLSSVETLGATSVIGTDKTGTLTENRMTVERIVWASGEWRATSEEKDSGDNGEQSPTAAEIADDSIPYEALRIGVLCNNASLEDQGNQNAADGVGDPMEVALLVAGRDHEMSRDELLQELPEVREKAFDPDTKMMATFHGSNGRYDVAVKGAPEAVLAHCSMVKDDKGEHQFTEQDQDSWIERNNELAARGLRVLAMATKKAEDQESDPYQDLTFVGFVTLRDPARADVPHAIEECYAAGIRVVMMTGDQPGTAKAIAQDIGMTEDDDQPVVLGSELPNSGQEIKSKDAERLRDTLIFARVSPKQKLDIIELHQAGRAIVAMTGDGVNDAPALKKADIGIAMGQRGTQVA